MKKRRPLRLEPLEPRVLLAIDTFPVPLTGEAPDGSLIYRTSAAADIDTVGDTDWFVVDLDDGQTVTVAVDPDVALQPEVALFDPGSVSLATATAITAGAEVVLQTVPTDGAGSYTVQVTGAAGTTGDYAVTLILNAAVEQEQHGGPPNTAIDSAQDLDGSFTSLALGEGARGAVLGALGRDIVNHLGGDVNSVENDLDPAFSADGLTLVFSSDRPGGTGGKDLYIARRASTTDPFGDPVPLGADVNTASNETGPALWADGLTLYFGSNRAGGSGSGDVYVATRATLTDPFGQVTNLGPEVNSAANDNNPSISADGLTLVLNSSRAGGEGRQDIYLATRASMNDPFSNVTNLGPAINSIGADSAPSLSADGRSLYFHSNRPGGVGGTDLYVARRDDPALSFGRAANLGVDINSSGNDRSPGISSDGSTLLFDSDRPDGVGNRDLYAATLTGSDWYQFTLAGGESTTLALSAFDREADRQSVAFQQNEAGYEGTVDTYLPEANADVSFGVAPWLNVDADDPGGTGMQVEALIRFDDVFGAGAGQIATTADIRSARLELDITGPGDSMRLHRMLQDWSDLDTWNRFGGNGVQADDVEAIGVPDAVTEPPAVGQLSIDVTRSVEAWQQDPSMNFGWVLLPTGNNGVDFYSSEGMTPPRLVVELAGAPAQVELYDPAGRRVARSVGGGENVGQVISDFVAVEAGAYTARVGGDVRGDYQLVVTRNTAFDAEPNGSFADAQDIAAAGGALGHVRSGANGTALLEAGAARGGAAVFGGAVVEEKNLEPRASIVLPYNSELTFQEAIELLGQPAAVPDTKTDNQRSDFSVPGALDGPIAVLQDFPGPAYTGFIPPDPIAAAGPEQIVAIVNTDLAVYDKVTGDELFRQNMNGSSGFFGSVGATGTVFDPWVLFDPDVQRFFAMGIELPTSTTSNIYLAVSTDATPTNDTDWYKYQIDFTNTPAGDLGSGAHFPDYPKMGISGDAIWISGNYFPIDFGDGVYAGITALDKASLVAGAPVQVLYDEFFDGFSVFPMTQYGSGSVEYFAEAFTGGGGSIVLHAVSDVLTAPQRTTATIAVPSYDFPDEVPQQGGGAPADAIDARVMTGVWRDGSMWFGHPIEDPALGDGEAVARWYQVDTNDFPVGTPTLVQAGNVDPGPGVYAWMPAVAVDGRGNLGIGFSLGGPDQYFGAGFTGRLASDPAGEVILPVTEYVSGQAPYQKIDSVGRNRWGDYSGMSIDPADDATFWVFNEYAAENGDWATRVASFQLQEPFDEDWYRLEVRAGDSLTITTSTPGGGPLEFVNTLDPAVELYDPAGQLVAADDNSAADDRNARLIHAATEAGGYRVRVVGGNTSGEYALHVSGATGALSPFAVIATEPVDGTHLASAPQQMVVDFSDAILLTTLDAADLTVDGVPALAVTATDGDTAMFTMPAGIGEGPHNVAIAAGAVLDLQGTPIALHVSQFTVDQTAPRVTFSAIQEGDVVGTGPLTYVAVFDEALDDFVLDAADVTLVDGFGQSYSTTRFEYLSGTSRLTLEYEDLPEGQFTLTLRSGNGAFEDRVGNNLDGEPLAFPIPPNTSGDGVAGGDFVVHFGIDIVSTPARDFERLDPLGSLMFANTGNAGLINWANDEDTFEFFIEGGQTIAAIATPDDPDAILALTLVGGKTTLAAPGQPVVLLPQAIDADGIHAVQVRGSMMTTYRLDIYRNAALEAEVGDSGPGSSVPTAAVPVALGLSRYGAIGTSEPSSVAIDTVVFGVQPATGQVVKVDPATATIVDSFPAPDGLAPGQTQIGLSIAEGGDSLIYVNSDIDPTTLWRLDPVTGAILSTETLWGDPIDGLGYEGTSVGLPPEQGLVFLSHHLTDIHRQEGFSGPNVHGWAIGSPVGAIGGDDAGRQFGFFFDGSIHEYDPLVDTNSYLSTLPAPAPDIEGMAFDGTNLYVATAGGDLVTLNPDDGSVLGRVSVPGGPLYGLGVLDLAGSGDGLVPETEPNDSVAIAQDLEGPGWTLANNSTIENSTSVPHVSIEGTGNGTFDYYAFDVALAGVVATFDMDATNFDTQLFLFDQNGNLLAENDDSGGDPGSSSSLDSRISFRFRNPGTYVIGVGEYFSFADQGGIVGDAPDAGDFYTLHVSIEDHPLGGGVLTIPEVDQYTVDLSGGEGETVDIILSGQDGADFSRSALQILDRDGTTVLASASPAPLGVPAANYDVGILGFTVPVGGLYTVRLTTAAEGAYGLLATRSLAFDSEPNDGLADPLRRLDDPASALGFLGDTAAAARLFGVDALRSEIVELDPGTGAELNRFSTPEPASGGPDGLAFDGTSLFFFNGFGSATLFELDPDTGSIVDGDSFADLGISSGIDGLGAVGGLVAALDYGANRVFFVDTDADVAVGSWLAPVSLVGGLAGAGARHSVFASDFDSGQIRELDASTGVLINTFPAPGGGSVLGLAFTGGNLYAGHTDGTIDLLDPNTGATIDTFSTAAGFSALGGDDPSGPAPLFPSPEKGGSVSRGSETTSPLETKSHYAYGSGMTAARLQMFAPAVLTAYLPQDQSFADIAAQMQMGAGRVPGAQESGLASLVLTDETEPNDTIATANPVPLGFDVSEDPRIEVAGTLGPAAPPVALTAAEPDGAIPLATPTGLTTGNAIVASATIGDGAFGTTTGDYDWYGLSGVTGGQTITIDVDAWDSGSSLDPVVGVYGSAGELLAFNDDAGSLDSFLNFTVPVDDDYFVVVRGYGSNFQADPFDPGSGGGVGSQGFYDVTIGLDMGDIDFFRVDLDAGDILGANLQGDATHLSLRDSSGSERIGSRQDLTFIHPLASPLPGGGNAALSWVVDTPGAYYVAVSSGTGAYQLELDLFRPALEDTLIGDHQILYVDFDGATIDTSIFGGAGTAALSPLSAFLADWGLAPTDESAVIDAVVAVVEENLSTDLRTLGLNGDFATTGTPGQFDIEIRNSRDDADPFGLPNVSRVIVGGTTDELGITTIGIAESIDVGNFATEETAVVLLDLLSGPTSDPNSLNQYVLDPAATMLDLVGTGVGNIVAHEAGHLFADWHTDQFNAVADLMDQGGNLDNTVGVGSDRVFGSADDVDVDFGSDTYVPNEGFTGLQNTLNAIAFGLATGTVDPALVGPTVTDLGLRGTASDDFVLTTGISVAFSEPIMGISAGNPANYRLLEAGPNGLFEAGASDDITIPITPTFDGRTMVDLEIDRLFSPLRLGSYQLTIDGSDTGIVDLDGNPLGSRTGPGGGSDFVHEFDVAFDVERGGDLYQVDLVAGQVLTVHTEIPFDNPSARVANDLDPQLVVLDPSGNPAAVDANSFDGKNALLELTATQTGRYTIQVVAESGIGEYQLVADVGGIPPVGDVNEDGFIDGRDVDLFVEILLNHWYKAAADMDRSGEVNGLDVGPFVAILLNGIGKLDTASVAASATAAVAAPLSTPLSANAPLEPDAALPASVETRGDAVAEVAAELGTRRGMTTNLAEVLPATSRFSRRELRGKDRHENIWREDHQWVTGQPGNWMDTVAVARARELGRSPGGPPA